MNTSNFFDNFVTPSSPLTKEEIAKINLIIENLEENPQVEAFLEPVDFICKFLFFLFYF